MQVAAVAGIATILVALAWVTTAVGDLFCSGQRTCSRACLPKHAYGHDDRSVAGSILAVAPVGQPTQTNQFFPAADADGKLKARAIRRKIFTPAVASLTVDHVKLQRISLALYDDGQLDCTGGLSHDGGPNGALLGNRVTIRVRAYAGVPQHPNVDNAAPLMWETTRELWSSRRRPVAISLVPGIASARLPHGEQIEFFTRGNSSLADAVRRHFDEITHLEVELEYRKDR